MCVCVCTFLYLHYIVYACVLHVHVCVYMCVCATFCDFGTMQVREGPTYLNRQGITTSYCVCVYVCVLD